MKKIQINFRKKDLDKSQNSQNEEKDSQFTL